MMSSSLAREAYLAATSGAGEWQDDVKLYQPFQEQMVLPELAKCYGIETLLDLHKLGYEVIPRRNAEFISPSGKVPVLRADNRVLGEESILSFLQRKGLFSCKDLSDEKKLRTKALISVLETKLIPIERCCVLFTSFDCSSNFVEFVRQQSLANCSAYLTTPHKNNMQQMVTKCCVLLGEKFGSFYQGLSLFGYNEELEDNYPIEYVLQ